MRRPNMRDNAIKNILIVGGGTAGWMTASLLNRFLGSSKCTITLVESAEIGIIGVGEATVPPLVSFLRAIGADENDFMRQCHASFKLGIKFIDWYRVNHSLWHPFGPVGSPIDHIALFHHWLKSRRLGRNEGPYTSYSLQTLLGDLGKAPRTVAAHSVVTQQGGYAYHLDAREFAAYLARLATHRGVKHLVDNVRSVGLDERGFIRHIDTEKNGALSADLFIDCTGFAGMLIERALGDRYVPWSDYLLCDRALALPQPYDEKMASYTQATARSAGWIWRIPLSHRVGSGYVYSSRFISDDHAARELLAWAGDGPDLPEPRQLRMRIGRRTNFWVKNCVSVGLSSGFLEPLESTGIYLIQKSVEALLDLFPDAGHSDVRVRHYNMRVGRAYDEVRDFIIMHYMLSQRDDTEFWKAARSVPLPDSLAETLELYDETGAVNWQHHSLFGETSFYAIVAGFERLPRRHAPLADFSNDEGTWRALEAIKARNQEFARSVPAQSDYLAELYGTPDPGRR
jgi:tryptophan halogenase